VKLLVFAHKPPPHHGQSYMVEQLLESFGGDAGAMEAGGRCSGPDAVECYHVDCRFSDDMTDIGRARPGKVFLALKYCAQAIRFRWRFGVRRFLYIPAPPMPAAILRDWLVMALCRPFFPQRVYFWQAAGLGEWLKSSARPWQRWLTRVLLGKPDLSIVLGEYCRTDADAFGSKQTAVVPNGIPDPCPDFQEKELPARLARVATRKAMLASNTANDGAVTWFDVLFLSLCTREKGLFDTLEAVALANARLGKARSPLRARLTVAGKFWREQERIEFEQRIARPDLNGGAGKLPEPVVRYCGFVSGAEKSRLLRESDCLCFPTYYQAESFGIVIIEAMAHGLPVITTRWRTIPELLPPAYAGLVQPRAPEQIAAALCALVDKEYDPSLRGRFLERFTVLKFADGIKSALLSMPPV
jgi:glycosyltransferase involved in cell wall biosynthesis